MNIDPALEAKIVHTADCRCVDCMIRRNVEVVCDALESISQSEKEFSASFFRFARSLLWDGYHTHDSRRSKEGYPDWTLWRERVIFAELKAEDGKTTAAQDTVIEGLRKAGAEVYVWRPSDWKTIVEVLT